jgi:streptogramin lyase
MTVFAQNDIAIGQWRSHFPVNRMISVTQSQDKVYYAGEQMVLVLDKTERSISRLDKVSGLTQVGIRVIKYYPAMELLLIAYNDGNIDVVEESGVTNVSDIKRYSLISEKSINHIHFADSFAYLSCSFGLVQMDLTKYEIKNTYLTDNFGVNASSVLEGKIYMSTEEGIYEGDQSLNLSDFSNWVEHDMSKNLPFAYFSNAIEWFDGRLFATVNDTVKYYDGTNWQHFSSENAALPAGHPDRNKPFLYRPNEIIYLETSLDGERLIMTTSLSIMAVEKNGFYFPHGTGDFINSPRQAIRAGGVWYYADYNKGANILEGFNDFTKIEANAPFSNNMYQMTVANNNLYVTAGGVNGSWNALNRPDGLFLMEDGIWSFRNKFYSDSLVDVNDMMPVAVHPSNGKVYTGSYRKGLVEFDGDNFQVFGKEGTTLNNPELDPFSVRVTGLAFDQDENLWISNYEAPEPISVLRVDGTWESFPLPSASAQVADMVIDRSGNKWMVVARGSEGIAVFNENEAVVGGTDNRYRILTPGNSELPSKEVNCLAVDRDGDVWVGTVEGTAVFECGGQMFSAEGCRGRKVIVEEDDFGEYLLKTENVTTIAIDGADRKWFGTDNGIFVQSPDGEETVFRFTTDNSPLPSDKIVDIAINDQNGEVFISTEQGLVSYRSDATAGTNTHAADVYAYPNPVRPNYDGPIAIKGLVNDANVKITDISGALIYETTALGGQAIWNGRDYNGRKAATGVYLVFSSNRDGLETLVTKLVFVN